jgi:hypothetical protein
MFQRLFNLFSHPRHKKMHKSQRRKRLLESLEDRAMMAADFNGDGIDDLVVGIAGDYDSVAAIADAGAVNIYYGPMGSSAPQFLNKTVAGLVPAASDNFGKSITYGDFNNDGYDDLAVGAPGAVGGGGQVLLFPGSAGGILPTATVLQQGLGGVPDSVEANDNFGDALAAGDLNNDGYDDLAIGVPREDIWISSSSTLVDSGIVHLMLGSAGGIVVGGIAIDQDYGPWAIADVREGGDLFGAALAIGDLDNVANDDLAIGVPGEDITAIVDAGGVNVIYNYAGANNFLLSQNTPAILDISETGDAMGSSLAIADFDGANYGDLAVGVPLENVGAIVDAGMVNIMYSNATRLNAAANVALTQAMAGEVVEAGDQFGYSVAGGNFDASAADELAIGSPFENIGATSDAGAVNVYSFGRTAALFLFQGAAGVPGLAEANDHFGVSLSTGNFNNTGYGDLAVGVPDEDWGAFTDAGEVDILFDAFASGILINEGLGATNGDQLGSSLGRRR